MAATYMLRKHLRSMELAGSPEAIAEREISREAHERALADCKRRYPVLTAENFETADEYRNERVAYWAKHLTTHPGPGDQRG